MCENMFALGENILIHTIKYRVIKFLQKTLLNFTKTYIKLNLPPHIIFIIYLAFNL